MKGLGERVGLDGLHELVRRIDVDEREVVLGLLPDSFT